MVRKNNLGIHEKTIVDKLTRLVGRFTLWQVWQDFITMFSISLANATDSHNVERENLYKKTVSKYSTDELNCFAEMASEIVIALDQNPNRDFLGELFMSLNLGDEWKGQFFTPYNICRLMAKMQSPDEIKKEIDKNGYITVNDPACGAGALLIAYANNCALNHINYQQKVFFVAQDIDFLAGMMCYIQLSLLGCSGCVIIGNSLTTPLTINIKNLKDAKSDSNIWYTPMTHLTWTHF